MIRVKILKASAAYPRKGDELTVADTPRVRMLIRAGFLAPVGLPLPPAAPSELAEETGPQEIDQEVSGDEEPLPVEEALFGDPEDETPEPWEADPSEIRSWARDNGYDIGYAGRIPADIRDAYLDAMTAPESP